MRKKAPLTSKRPVLVLPQNGRSIQKRFSDSPLGWLYFGKGRIQVYEDSGRMPQHLRGRQPIDRRQKNLNPSTAFQICFDQRCAFRGYLLLLDCSCTIGREPLSLPCARCLPDIISFAYISTSKGFPRTIEILETAFDGKPMYWPFVPLPRRNMKAAVRAATGRERVA